MAATYSLQVLRIDPGGTPRVSHLTIAGDTDIGLDGDDTETVWTLDGVELAAPPEMFFSDFTGVAQGPFNPVPKFGISFVVDGVDYVLTGFGLSPDMFISASGVVPNTPLGGSNFVGSYGTIDGGTGYQGEGLFVRLDIATGAFLSAEVRTMVVVDDDDTIGFDGTGGAPASETGGSPVLLPGSTGSAVTAGVLDAAENIMVMVRVSVTLVGGGATTFDAMRNERGTGEVFYIPLAGSIDLAAVATVTGEVVLAGSLDGMAWADFGLETNRIKTLFGTGDDVFDGNFWNEKADGGEGNDRLFGDHGDDLLIGGRGKDSLYGGLNGDRVEGGGGNDDIYGGEGDDKALGGKGRDLLDGFWGDDDLAGEAGDDRLFGGEGRDTLVGGAGGDTLEGGDGGDDLAGGSGGDDLDGGRGDDTLADDAGRDTLTGGGGADTFVLPADGSTDRVLDFEDGADRIDLGVNFGQLALTDVAPGQVEIAYGGEKVVVFDLAGVLAAADFSAADFI